MRQISDRRTFAERHRGITQISFTDGYDATHQRGTDRSVAPAGRCRGAVDAGCCAVSHRRVHRPKRTQVESGRGAAARGRRGGRGAAAARGRLIDYLDLEDLLEVARHAVGPGVAVRDYGLLESALARPRASVFGQDAYPDVHLKAAALLHSLARNHALVDGNKRLAWTACRTFLAINGEWISAPEDQRFDFVIGVATGAEPDLAEIAGQLRAWSYREG